MRSKACPSRMATDISGIPIEMSNSLFRHEPLAFPDNIMVCEVMQQSLLSWLTLPLALLAYRSWRSSPI